MSTFQPSSVSAKPNSGWWPLPDSWYPFDQGTSASDRVNLDSAIKGLSEAQVKTISQLKTFTQMSMELIRDERQTKPLSSAQLKDLLDQGQAALDYAINKSATDPSSTAGQMVNVMALLQKLAANYEAPRTRDAILKALKWTSANATSVQAPKAEDPLVQAVQKRTGQEPDSGWIVPVVIAGVGAVGLGTYYYFYIRPKSR